MTWVAATVGAALLPGLVAGGSPSVLPRFATEGCYHSSLPNPSATVHGTLTEVVQTEVADERSLRVEFNGTFVSSFDQERMNMYSFSALTGNVTGPEKMVVNKQSGFAMNMSEGWLTVYEKIGSMPAECVTHTWPREEASALIPLAHGAMALSRVLTNALATCVGRDRGLDEFVIDASLPGSLPLDLPWKASLAARLAIDRDGIPWNQSGSFAFERDGQRAQVEYESTLVDAHLGGPSHLDRVPAGWGPCREEPVTAFSADLVAGGQRINGVPAVGSTGALALAARESVQRTAEKVGYMLSV